MVAGFKTRRVTVSVSPVVVTLEVAAPAIVDYIRPDRETTGWRDGVTGATTLTKADLDRIPAMTPDESLKVISGFSLFRRSTSRASNPTTHGVTMRGLSASGSSRALVVLNGIPLNDGFGGWITWERLPPAAIDQITVQRGPMGDVFGSDALGGAIMLVTPSNRRPSGTASFETASLDTRSLSASGGGATNNAFVFGAASWFDSAGFIPVEPATRGPVDTPMDTTWTNAFGKATFGTERRLTLSGWGGRDDRGNGTALQRNASHGGTGSALFEGTFYQFAVTAAAAESANRYEQTFTSIGAGRATEKLTSTQDINTDVFRSSLSLGRPLSLGRGSGVVHSARWCRARRSDFADVRPTSTLSSSLVDNNQALSAQLASEPNVQADGDGRRSRGEWRAAGASGSAAASDDKSAVIGRAGLALAINQRRDPYAARRRPATDGRRSTSSCAIFPPEP